MEGFCSPMNSSNTLLTTFAQSKVIHFNEFTLSQLTDRNVSKPTSVNITCSFSDGLMHAHYLLLEYQRNANTSTGRATWLPNSTTIIISLMELRHH